MTQGKQKRGERGRGIMDGANFRSSLERWPHNIGLDVRPSFNNFFPLIGLKFGRLIALIEMMQVCARTNFRSRLKSRKIFLKWILLEKNPISSPIFHGIACKFPYYNSTKSPQQLFWARFFDSLSKSRSRSKWTRVNLFRYSGFQVGCGAT